MFDLLKALPQEERDLLHWEEPPGTPEPMLAVLTDETFSDPDWIYERKLDGERVLAVVRDGKAGLVTRNGKDASDTYPEVQERLEEVVGENGSTDAASATLVLDGEIVAFSQGITSFSRLQNRMHLKKREEARESPVAVYFYLFDLLHLAGYDLTGLPLRTRKSLLQQSLRFKDPLRFTPHRNEEGEELLEIACSRGWEGVLAKRSDSPYRHTRSKDWLKFKCVNRHELVIGGFTDPGGSRIGFGALLVGYYEEDESGDRRLRYAGKVGTGFDEETLKDLHRKLDKRERKTPPFSDADAGRLPGKEVYWVTPNLVGEFGFTEWTDAGRLRHPRFLGLRRDKEAEDVEKEEPVSPAAEPAP